jgi:hypothetical protein
MVLLLDGDCVNVVDALGDEVPEKTAESVRE